MQCYFLASVDKRGRPTGCVSLPTPSGQEVVILFRGENEKMNLIGQFFADRLPKGSHGIRTMYMEVSSFEEAARELQQTFLDLDAVTFLVDSDPFVTQLVAFLRQRAR
jgi:hypothetical protein